MSESKIIFKSPIINILITVACIFSAAALLLDNDSLYSSVALLPTAYLIIHIAFQMILPKAAYRNIGYMLYLGLSAVKCVIAPLVLCLGDYRSLFGFLSSTYVFYAVLLLIYEHVVCMTVIAYTAKKAQAISEKAAKKTSKPKFKPAALLGAFSAFMLILWFLIPGIKNNFVSVFDMLFSDEMFLGNDYTSQNAAGTFVRIFTTLFLVLFKSLRIILPLYVIKRLKDKYDSLLSFFASFAVIALQFLFIPETVAMSLIVAFTLLLYMLDLYPRYRRATVTAMAASVVFIAFVLSLSFEYMSRWHGVNTVMQYLSQVLQSYVPGVCNTASIFRVIPVDKFTALIDTLVSTVPFQTSIFGEAYWANDLNTLFTSTPGLKSQIVSTIGGGWYLFGPLLAPLFSAIFVRVSMVNGYKYEGAGDTFKKALYLFMCIQTVLGVGVYNIQTTVTMWIQVGLVLWLCSRLTADSRKGAENES